MIKSLKSFVLKSVYLVVVSAVILITLEFTARSLGLGTPAIYYNSASGGLRPLPGQKVNRLKGSTITIDENGFRSTGQGSELAFRVLYLGDSVTWGGSSVDDTEIFSEVAADAVRASGMEVYAMNSGVNGTSLMNHAEIFEQWKDSVDVLVWLFPWNDVYRSFASAGFLWPPTKRPNFALVEAMDHVIRTRWLTSFREEPSAATAEFVSPEVPAGYEQFFDTVLAERMDKNLRMLEQTVSMARANGIPVIVGITPRIEGGRIQSHSAETIRAVRSAEALGVHVLDVSAIFATAVDVENAFIDAVHFTAKGHRLVGEVLGRELSAILSDMCRGCDKSVQ